MTPRKLWFVTGSQHLYGAEALKQVESNAKAIVSELNGNDLPVDIELKPLSTDPDGITKLCNEANADSSCVGVLLWMHTFSPGKMWIRGLSKLSKPICYLHTQFSQQLPWDSIDMDYMNLHQSAHGDREAGHIAARLGLRRKVIVGHWKSQQTLRELSSWIRVVLGWHDWQGAKFARIGDNMRSVSVTEGDKVQAEIQFGFSVNGFGVGDLVKVCNEVSDSEIDKLCAEYEEVYNVAPELQKGGERHSSLRYAARQEIGLRRFLEEGNFKGFTTTFEDLHGLEQLPGLACQRLMADGYGFGAEGDWKTSALLRLFKEMESGLEPGTSFMEDYTYDLSEGNELVLGAHMLEICPTISKSKPRLEIHPLGIGGKDDPVRMVFDAKPGPAINVSLIDLGHRFRLIVSEVEAIEVPAMPKLPVARALWKVQPNFNEGVAGWIYAGGAHHTVYTYNVTTAQVRDLAEIAGVECVVIGKDFNLNRFRDELRWNEVSWSRG